MIEEWRNIKGFERLYQISSLGRVRSFYKGHNLQSDPYKIMKQKRGVNGYMRIGLHKDGKYYQFSIHRLVASAFIPRPIGKNQINHINANKEDNRVENLEWVTPKENMAHAYKMGLLEYQCRDYQLLREGYERNKTRITAQQSKRVRGVNNPNVKLSKEQVKEIVKLVLNGEKICEIAKKMGLRRQNVQNIARGYQWDALPEGYVVPVRYGSHKIEKLKNGIVIATFELMSEAAKEFPENPSAHSAISACCRGKRKTYKGFEWRYAD